MPNRDRTKSLPQEFRALEKTLPQLWKKYDATPEHRVDQRFEILKEILTVQLAGVRLYESLEAAGEPVGAMRGWGKKDPTTFYFWQAKALRLTREELGKLGKRAAKRPESIVLVPEILDRRNDAALEEYRLARKLREREAEK
jgi:hypothetical protein